MNQAVAVKGTRRTYKELVDGTLRVTVDIDPPFRRDFLRLFPDIDTAVALAPVADRPDVYAEPIALAVPVTPEPKPKSKAKFPGGLTGLAVRWCIDEAFQAWLMGAFGNEWDLVVQSHKEDVDPAEVAKEVICNVCGIGSRKELDANHAAGAIFDRKFRLPYHDLLEAVGK